MEIDVAVDAGDPDGAGVERRKSNINSASNVAGAINVANYSLAGDARNPDVSGHLRYLQMAASLAYGNIAVDPADFEVGLTRQSQYHSLANLGRRLGRG